MLERAPLEADLQKYVSEFSSGKSETDLERYVSEISSLWNMGEVELERHVLELSSFIDDGDKSEIFGSGTTRICAKEKSQTLTLFLQEKVATFELQAHPLF